MKYVPLQRSIPLGPDDTIRVKFELDFHNDLDRPAIMRGIRWEPVLDVDTAHEPLEVPS